MTSSPLLLFNATLTLVTTQGGAADYDRDPTAGTTKWQGSNRAFYVEMEQRLTTSQNQNDVIIARHLLVDPSQFPGVEFKQGDHVTVTVDTGANASGPIRKVQLDGSADTGYVTRLTLEDA